MCVLICLIHIFQILNDIPLQVGILFILVHLPIGVELASGKHCIIGEVNLNPGEHLNSHIWPTLVWLLKQSGECLNVVICLLGRAIVGHLLTIKQKNNLQRQCQKMIDTVFRNIVFVVLISETVEEFKKMHERCYYFLNDLYNKLQIVDLRFRLVKEFLVKTSSIYWMYSISSKIPRREFNNSFYLHKKLELDANSRFVSKWFVYYQFFYRNLSYTGNHIQFRYDIDHNYLQVHYYMKLKSFSGYHTTNLLCMYLLFKKKVKSFYVT